MNAQEAAQLCMLAKTLSPAQAVEEYTPQAWALVMRHIRYEDAKDALAQLGGEQEWIHVSHIVKRVKRMRAKRVADFGPIPDPPADLDPDDRAAYIRWLDATTEAIADGTWKPATPEALGGRRNVIRELGMAGTSVDSALAIRPLRDAYRDAKKDLQAAMAEEKRAKDERRAEVERMRAADRAAREALVPHE